MGIRQSYLTSLLSKQLSDKRCLLCVFPTKGVAAYETPSVKF